MNNKSHLVCHEVNSTSVVIYHSLRNQPQRVEFETEDDKLEFMETINQGTVETGFADLDQLILLGDNEARFASLCERRRYLSKLKTRISFLSLMTAENCNLGCSYCIAATNMEEAKKNKSLIMPWEIAKKGLDWYFTLPTVADEHYVNFSGGEPLINRNVVTKAIEYIRSNFREKAVSISINTNATLIDQDLARFFANNEVEIATSLDGTPAASDLVRITKKGYATSGAIVEAWRRLLNAGCKLTASWRRSTNAISFTLTVLWLILQKIWAFPG